MELKELVDKTVDMFQLSNINELSDKLYKVCINNQFDYYDKFKALVEDLSIDWLQKIFQYYEADRKEKKQDYTPLSLARFVGMLSDSNEDCVIDMCAGSGALTIQKWNLNHNLRFICKEFDEKVISFLLFNLAVRNIEAEVFHMDVLQDEIFHKYKLTKTDTYSEIKEVKC